MKKGALKYYTFLPFLLLCCFYVYKAIAFPAHDFANYYFGGKFFAEGNLNSNIYFPYEFNKAIFNSGHSQIFASYAPNTPFLAIFFLIFSFISLALAKLIFNGISVFLIIFSLYRLFLYYKIDWRHALLMPLLFFVPIKNELLFGQVYFLLFFLLSECFLAYEKEQFKKTAFFLSLAILIKVFPLILVLLFVFKKQYKPLFYTFVFCFLFFGISTLFTGFDVWLFWFNSVLPKASNGEIATAFVDNYQSVFMFLKRLFIYEKVENPHPFFHADSLFIALVFAYKIGVLFLGYIISSKSSNSIIVFSYWILASILLSPYGSTYTFVLLLFPFLALVKSEISNSKKALFFIILFLINNLPLSIFIQNVFPFSYLRLFLLLAFAITFVVLLFQKSSIIKASIFSVFVFIIGSFFWESQPEKSSRFFSTQTPILIYNYEIKNNNLIYYYWNEKGENKKNFTLCKSNNVCLKIKKNQIFYNNRQLTFDKSNKLKPILINGKLLVFLSDYDRGIGFYSLRIIPVNFKL